MRGSPLANTVRDPPAIAGPSLRLAQWLSWLERRPVTAEVVGSSPIWVGFFLSGILAQLGEHLPYKQGVTGSSPVASTFL